MRFPLAALELTRTARQSRTYLLRLLPAALAAGVVAYLWLTLSARWVRGEEVAAIASSTLRYLLIILASAIVLIITPMLASAAIAREREEGTLDLLLLAESRGWDIFLAKFFSVFLQTQLLLLSLGPLLAITSALGGITLVDILGSVVVFSCISLQSTVFGLALSALMLTPRRAFVPAVIGSLLLAAVHYVILDFAGPEAFFSLLLIFTGILIPIAVRQIAVGSVHAIAVNAGVRVRTARRFRKSAHAPLAALYARSLHGHWTPALRLPVFLIAIPVVAALMLYTDYVYLKFFEILVLYDVISSIAWARRHGTLDDLTLTGRSPYDIANAIARVHLAKSVPFVIVFFFATLGEFFYPFWGFWTLGMPFEPPIAYLIFGLSSFLSAATNIVFFAMIGCAAAALVRSVPAQLTIGIVAGIVVQWISSFQQTSIGVFYPGSLLLLNGSNLYGYGVVLLVDTFIFGLASLGAYLLFRVAYNWASSK